MNFKAYYDVANDRIMGCDPFTYSWFHEDRHRQQFTYIPKLKSFNQWLEVLTYGLTSGFMLGGVVGILSIGWTLILMGLSTVPYSMLNLMLELDALVFGTWNWYRHHHTK